MSVAARREALLEHETVRFATRDWLMLSGVALTWGASFLFIDIGLEHFAPALVAFGRIAFGALTLGAFPAARGPVPRSAWPQIVALGVTWMAIPFVLFAIAQQWIDSSLAGMINAATPLFVALVAASAVRRLPTRMQATGLIMGFAGVVAISLPSVGDGSNALGIVLVIGAAFLYGFAFNIAGPLQRRYGSLPVIWRAQLVAVALVLPFAVVGGVSLDLRVVEPARGRRTRLARNGARVLLVHDPDRAGGLHTRRGGDLHRARGGDPPRRAAERRVDPRGGAARHGARAHRRVSDEQAEAGGAGLACRGNPNCVELCSY